MLKCRLNKSLESVNSCVQQSGLDWSCSSCGAKLEVCSFREVHVVDGIDDWLGSERSPTKVTAIEALEGVVAALHVGKLDVDFTVVRVAEETAVHNGAIPVVALFTEVVFEVFHPVRFGFPNETVSNG